MHDICTVIIYHKTKKSVCGEGQTLRWLTFYHFNIKSFLVINTEIVLQGTLNIKYRHGNSESQ